MVLFETSSDDITFEYVENQKIQQTVTLKNVYSSAIAFKVKCTNPNTFQVKPNKGVLRFQEKIVVSFILEPIQIKDAEKVINEKFQVRAYPIEGNLTQQQVDQQWQTIESNKIQQQKLVIEMYQVVDGRKNFFKNNQVSGYMKGSGIGSSSMYYSTIGGQNKFMQGLNQNSEYRKQFSDLGQKYEQTLKEHNQMQQERYNLYLQTLNNGSGKSKSTLNKVKELGIWLFVGIIIGYVAV